MAGQKKTPSPTASVRVMVRDEIAGEAGWARGRPPRGASSASHPMAKMRHNESSSDFVGTRLSNHRSRTWADQVYNQTGAQRLRESPGN